MRLCHALLLATTALSVACATAGTRVRGDDDDQEDGGGGSTAQGPTGGPSSGSGAGGSGGSGPSSGAGATTSAGPSTNAASTSTGGMMCAHSNLTFTDPACGSCVEDLCCSSLQACDGSNDCLMFIDCAMNCLDDLCLDDCVASYPTGETLYMGLDGCITSSCSLDCGA